MHKDCWHLESQKWANRGYPTGDMRGTENDREKEMRGKERGKWEKRKGRETDGGREEARRI